MTILSKIKKYILDILFPIECLGCKEPDVWLCEKCLKRIPLTLIPNCPICHATSTAAVCEECRSKTSLDGLLIATSYENSLVQQAIHLLKYNYIREMAVPLSKLLVTYAISFDKKDKPAILQSPADTILIPVPLHKRRLLERGFNQSELLGQEICRYLPFNFQPSLLKRTRYTAAQAQLKKNDRETNLRDAFSLSQPFKLLGKNVILVDDVATTLTTLNECATVLKQAGCKRVWGLVIARGG